MGDPRAPELASVASPPRCELSPEVIQEGTLLGRGAQAVVQEATVTGDYPVDRIALKQPLAPNTLTRERVNSFLGEARKWATVDRRERTRTRWDDSEHIVGVVDTGENSPWIAIEYMDGGSLADRLAESGQLRKKEALWVAERLACGVEVAHNEGTVHLDLKPANVLFRETAAGRWDVPKIGDWGLARHLATESGSMDGISVEYAAPEQFAPSEFGDPGTLSDVYQLGAVVYALLTGQPPYTGEPLAIQNGHTDAATPPPPSQRRSKLSEKLDAVVRTALEPQKSDRYDSITQFKQALRAIRDGRQLPAFVETNHSETNSGQSIAPGKTDQEILPPALVGTETRSQREGVVCRKRIETQATDGSHDVVVRLQFDSSRTDSVECVLTETLPFDVSVSDASVTGSSSGSWSPTNTKAGVRFETTLSPDETLTTAYRIPATAIDRPASMTGEPQLSVKPTASQTQWQMFGCGPARRGTPADHTGPDAPVTTRWQFDTSHWVYSSPAVVDDTVYVGSVNGKLYAVSAITGTKQWWFDTDEGVHSSPAVVDDTVYVGDDDGSLYAVDAVTGNQQWQFDIDTDVPVRSSPAVVDGTVYVGSNDYNLYAVDAATGEEQWRFDTDGPVRSSPAVVDGTVYVGSDSHSLYAVDAVTGNKRWQFDTPSNVRSSPAVVDGTVYVGSNDYNLYAVDAATGNQEWRFDTHGSVRSSPAVVDGTVYVGSDDESLYAVDTVTGNQEWKFNTSGFVYSSPAVVDGTVYVGSCDESLYAVDAAIGSQVWQFNTSRQVRTSPAVVDGTVYVGSDDDNLYAIEQKE